MQNRQYKDSVRQKFSDINFPASKDDIMQRKGSETIEVGEGKRMSVRDILQPVGKDRFNSPDELLNSVDQTHNLNWGRD